MEGKDKSVLFGFHRFDPEINCQGLNDTHSINHRLNVIMRAGQVVKRGLQVPVTASYLKVWSQETKCQLEGCLAYVQHQPVSSSKDTKLKTPPRGARHVTQRREMGWALKNKTSKNLTVELRQETSGSGRDYGTLKSKRPL